MTPRAPVPAAAIMAVVLGSAKPQSVDASSKRWEASGRDAGADCRTDFVRSMRMLSRPNRRAPHARRPQTVTSSLEDVRGLPTEELFRRQRDEPDERVLEELVARFEPLARGVARRYQGRGEPPEDLTQVAMLGLLKAIARFDPDRGFAFSTYATPTMLGELKRYFRDAGWAVHVPRGVKERALEVARVSDELSALPRPLPFAGRSWRRRSMPPRSRRWRRSRPTTHARRRRWTRRQTTTSG